MKNTRRTVMFSAAISCTLAGLLGHSASAAATYYWDINGPTAGATDGTGVATGTFTNATWTTDSTGNSATAPYVSGSDLIFSAKDTNNGNAGIANGTYTVTMGTGALVANSVTINEGTITYSGTGSLSVVNNFSVGNGLTTTLSEPMGGVSFTKSGGGTLNLSTGAFPLTPLVYNTNGGTSAYTLGTAISATLALGVGGGSAVNLNAGTGAISVTSLYDSASGGGTISNASSTAGTTTLTVAPGAGNSFTYSGAINAGTRSFAITKAGYGSQTLAGNNSFTGATTIALGTLGLDYSSANLSGSKIGSASGLTMQSGTLAIKGNSSAATSDSVASLTLNTSTSAGGNYLRVTSGSGRNATFALNAISRAANAGTLDVTLTNTDGGVAAVTTTSPNTGYGMLGTGSATTATGVAYATFNGGRDWAVNSNGTTAGTGNIQALSNYTEQNDTSLWTANGHITSGPSAGFSGTLGGSLAINSLRYNSAGTADLGTATLTIKSGGILVTPTAGVSTLTNGSVTSSTSEIVVHQFNTADVFNLNSKVTGSGVAFTKAGPGTVVLSNSNNDYSGTTKVLDGILRVTGAGALGSGTMTILPSGTLELYSATTLDYGTAKAITINGGKRGYNGLGALYANGGGTIIYPGAITASGSDKTDSIGVAANTELQLSSLSNAWGNGAGAQIAKIGAGNLNLTGNWTRGGSSGGGFFVQEGTLTLSGANGSLAGATGVPITLTNNARLVLDNRPGNNTTSDRMFYSLNNNLLSNGGRAVMYGNATATSTETASALVWGGGQNTLEAQHGGSFGTTWTFANTNGAAVGWSRNGNATILFRGTHLGSAINDAAGWSVLRPGTQPNGVAGQTGTTTLNSNVVGTDYSTSVLNYKILPYAVAQEGTSGEGNTFGTLDNNTTTAANNRGIVPLQTTNYASAIGTSTNNVRLTGSATVTGAQTANSLVLVNADTNNDLSVSGGTSLSITSGGVLAPGAGNVVISTPLTTGSINEAIFHVTGQGKLTVGNIINASAAITKGGPGTLELNGAGTTATGAVTVNSGKLLLNAVNGAGTGNVKVWNGATLGGSGSTPGAVTVIRGGSVSPGNSPGTLSTGSVAFEAGANLVIDIEGASSFDMLNVTGQVDLLSDLGSNNWDPTQGATNLVLNVSNLGAGNIGNTFKIINNDGSDLVFGTFSNLVQGSTVTQGTYTFQVDYAGGDGNDVVLTLNSVAVPEPAMVGLLGAVAMLALRRRRA